MKMQSSLVMLVTLCIGQFAIASDNTPTNIDKLVQVSGFEVQLDSLEPAVEQIAMQKFALEPKISIADKEKIRQLIKNEYSSSQYKQDFKSTVTRELNEKEVNEILAVYKDPLVAEQAANEIKDQSNPNLQQEVGLFTAELSKNLPSEKRLQLVSDLIIHMSAVDQQVTLGKAIEWSAVVALTDGEPAFSKEDFLKDSNNRWKDMRPAIVETLRVGILYSVRRLSDEDLEKYVKAMKSTNALQKLSAIFMATVTNDMKMSTDKFMSGLKKLKNG